MKVRISGNSIRFRLKQSEVQTFAQTLEISEVTTFGPGLEDQLIFKLSATQKNNFTIAKSIDKITVEIPIQILIRWTNTELVGFEESIDTGKGKLIRVLVEKDFKCLDGSDEENADAYPNPNITC